MRLPSIAAVAALVVVAFLGGTVLALGVDPSGDAAALALDARGAMWVRPVDAGGLPVTVSCSPTYVEPPLPIPLGSREGRRVVTDAIAMGLLLYLCVRPRKVG